MLSVATPLAIQQRLIMFVLVLQLTYLDLGSNSIQGTLPPSWNAISASSICTMFAVHFMQCFYSHMSMCISL